MAYQSGDIILDDHYNDFVASVNAVWGTGTGDRGYGQSTTVSTVSAGNSVTATQWTTLLSRISSLATHQNSTITSITNPTTGDTIEAYTALSTNISTVDTNRLNRAGTGTDTSDTNATTNTWFTETTHTQTLAFAGGDEARYFFNAGGEVRISFNHAGSTTSDKNSEWNQLATQSGTIVLGASTTAKNGGSGTVTTLATTTGYYDLTTTDTVLFKQFADSSPYTTNYIEVRAKVSTAHSDGNGNNGEVITFTISYRDDAADDTSWDKSIYNVLDQVDGTTTTTTVARQPSTSTLSATWGTPSWTSTDSVS